ncbi:MAG: hypothetical protein NZL83_02280 [Candidatus Absconditabacterales bacterium]|nr:hypothetical protein [Candidatus Absconditabacterales bacterium]
MGPSVFASQQPSLEHRSCTACSATPPMLASYIRFVNEVVSIITNDQMSPQEMFLASLLGSSAEVSKQRQQDLKSQLDWIRGLNRQARRVPGIFTRTSRSLADATRKTKQFMDAVTFIARTFTLSNPGLGRSVLFKPKSIRRDRAQLLDLDDKLQILYLEIAREGNLRLQLDPRQRTRLLALEAKYGGDDGFLIEGTMVVMEKTTYADVVKALRKTNAAFKRFISLGIIVELTSDEIKELRAGGLQFGINRANAVRLRDEYSCSRQIGMCTSSFSQFGQAMKGATAEIGQAGKIAITEIRESVIALQYALKAQRYKKNTIQLQCQRSVDPQTGREIWIKAGGDGGIVYTFHRIGPGIKKPYRTKGSANSSPQSHTHISEKEVMRECNLKSWEVESKPEDRAMMERFLDRERTLLQSQYGIYINQARVDKSIWGFLDQEKKASQTENERTERRMNAGTELDTFNTTNEKFVRVSNSKEERKILQELQNQSYDINFTMVMSQQELENDLRSALFQTQNEHVAMARQTMYADVRPTMQLIASMTQQIRYITTVKGDLQNPTSTLNLLGKACQMQCGNLGGICWSQ